MGLYKKARKLAKLYGACIIFIDEIDAIGMSRQAGGGGGGMMGGLMGMGGSGLLNELLLQMDPPNIDNGWFSKLPVHLTSPEEGGSTACTYSWRNQPSRCT